MDDVSIASSKLSVDWLYSFTQDYYKGMAASLAAMNQRLTTIIGFSGVVLKFAADLSTTGTLAAVLRIVVFVALVACIICGAMGLMPKATGAVVPPSVLLDKWRSGQSEERAKMFVVASWKKSIEEMNDLRSRKAMFLERATRCLIAAILLFAGVFVLESLPLPVL